MLNPEGPSPSALVLVAALAVEALVGDPVVRWHPVALFGRAIDAVVRHAPRAPAAPALVTGLVLVLAAAGVVGVGSGLVLELAGAASPLAGVLAGGLLLKVSFAYRQLEGEALKVAAKLEAGDLVGARHALRALVSRDTTSLSAHRSASAAVESLAENLSDSLVAPMFYYALFGVPGALVYRALNTLDAMIGYHGTYEYLGRAAARADDVANLVPARLTSLLIVVGAATVRGDWWVALRVLRRDHARTESPNAGWPMAAMAGALRVRLEKPGQYVLGAEGADCSPASIRRAAAIVRRGALLAALLALLAVGWR